MKAIIYRPAKTAMQSGCANTKHWILKIDEGDDRFVEPLMGWTGSNDTKQQIKIKFDTKEEAISYARKKGIEYNIAEPQQKKTIYRSYSDNFK